MGIAIVIIASGHPKGEPEKRGAERGNTMKTKRQEATEIRDLAVRAAEGNEDAHQTLYPMFGSLSNDQASGLAIGLGLMLREMGNKENEHYEALKEITRLNDKINSISVMAKNAIRKCEREIDRGEPFYPLEARKQAFEEILDRF